MYTIEHRLDGQVLYRKELPMGSEPDYLDATQRFEDLAYQVIEDYFSEDTSEMEAPKDPFSSGILERCTRSQEPLRLTDSENRLHEVIFSYPKI